MKKLINLVKKENLNVEQLMMIKGAAGEQGTPLCSSARCSSVGCNSNVGCTSVSCSGMACNSIACITTVDPIRTV